MKLSLTALLTLLIFSTSSNAQTCDIDLSALSISQVDVSNQIMCFVGCAVGYELNDIPADATVFWMYGNGATGIGNDAYLESYTCYNEPGTYTVVATVTCTTGDTYSMTHVAEITCGWEDVTGCTYDTAINYNPLATQDDGSCEFFCPNDCSGDVNGDATVSIADILILLSQFGIVCD